MTSRDLWLHKLWREGNKHNVANQEAGFLVSCPVAQYKRKQPCSPFKWPSKMCTVSSKRVWPRRAHCVHARVCVYGWVFAPLAVCGTWKKGGVIFKVCVTRRRALPSLGLWSPHSPCISRCAAGHVAKCQATPPHGLLPNHPSGCGAEACTMRRRSSRQLVLLHTQSPQHGEHIVF